MTDASLTGVGGALQQRINGAWQPLSFFSRKLTPTQQRYSTFGRDLLAIYLSVKHFRPFLEGRVFHVATDHRALQSALPCSADRYTPREVRHLQFISEFTTDIRYVPGVSNDAADALSRATISSVTDNPTVTLADIAAAHADDAKLHQLLVDGFYQLAAVPAALSDHLFLTGRRHQHRLCSTVCPSCSSSPSIRLSSSSISSRHSFDPATDQRTIRLAMYAA